MCRSALNYANRTSVAVCNFIIIKSTFLTALLYTHTHTQTYACTHTHNTNHIHVAALGLPFELIVACVVCVCAVISPNLCLFRIL